MTAPHSHDPLTWVGFGDFSVTFARPHDQVLLYETFTDIASRAGTCYKATGWIPLGLTEGNHWQWAEFYVPNHRPKKLWIKALRPDAQTRLCAPVLDSVHACRGDQRQGSPAARHRRAAAAFG